MNGPEPPSEPFQQVFQQAPKPKGVKLSPSPEPSEKPSEQASERPAVERVTAICVNFKTPQLIKIAVRSLLSLYQVKVFVVDNGSHDDSTKVVRELSQQQYLVTAFYNQQNLGHGPALHRITEVVETEFFLAWDSDCEARKTGFLEKMIARMDADPQLYALGWRRWVDRASGVPLEWHLDGPPKKRFVAYAHPAASLYRTEVYRQLEPFINHGAPALRNMVSAEKAGWHVQHFPIWEYVKHLEAGTRRMYGGRWDPKPGETPGPWRKNARYPI